MLDAVTLEHIREFLTQRGAIRNARTINLERKILTVFFVRAVKNGHLKCRRKFKRRLVGGTK